MNITHVLLNNSTLGKITKEQRAGEFAVWQTSLHNPDFAEYAASAAPRASESSSGRTRRGDQDGPRPPGPALVEVITDPELV